MEKKTLGAFISLLRKEKGLTQRQLAELLNVSDKTVSHWECDETSPDISLLPLLAQSLGVTVDELLSGKKNPPQTPPQYSHNNPSVIDRAEQYAAKTVNKIKENANGDIGERYKVFRILSLVGTAISLVVLASVAFSTATGASFGSYYNFLFNPGIIALFGSLWTIAISLGFTIGARYYFAKELRPHSGYDEKEKEYIYKANAFTYNNIFLVLCILPVPIIGLDIFPFWANVFAVLVIIVAARLLLTVILSKKGIVRTGERKLLAIRYISIFSVSVVLVAGGLILLQENWLPAADNIVFDNAADFIAFMETPKEKPANAYLLDGESYSVTAMISVTAYPTTIPTAEQPVTQITSPVQEPPEQEETDGTEEFVMGLCGRDWVTFRWLNKEVFDCTYNDYQGTFHVITYEAKLKQKNIETFLFEKSPVIFYLFTLADGIVCFVLYMKKLRELES